MEMVAQWVRATRWRGEDERMARVQWAWAYRHTCGAAHTFLKAIEEKEKPFKLGAKKVSLEVKSVTKTPAPASYQVLWEEHVTERNAPTIKTQLWTGTFTVGRLTLKTMDDLLDNRLGICINGFDLSPQSSGRAMRWSLCLLVVCLVVGCQPHEEPLPPTAPPPEDLSTWTVPELVQPERQAPRDVAQQTAKLPAGASEKVYDYKPGVAVEALVPIGMPLDIVLEPGEQVRQIIDGDRAPAEQGQARRWEVKEGGDGSGADLRPQSSIATIIGISGFCSLMD